MKRISFKFGLFIFVLFSLFNCNNSKLDKNCDTPVLDSLINRQISFLETIGPQEALDGKALLALFFFEESSGMNSSAQYGDISYYEKKDEIIFDINKWKEWYNSNRCSLKLDSLKLIEVNLRNSNTWILLDQ
ncbi:MAG: hypothetical protein AAFO07_13735 [Bacteroidota bacterium]